ncbi:F-box/kelch-repeat protein At3g23880-like [Chenopodium quinoa]|uniref:F-box/kelch-repeat protein At3g23880-like n=1 Tax=Chenopodium quinoa TaxID=63459 RepID=UPI000B77F23A|nr:F-box/kelch-repeat protein At3g23880-like [Chenopodium quinoa]
MVQNIDEYDPDDEFRRELPQHLITDEILTRLPVKSLLRFKSVSKLWYATISSCEFSWSHLERYMMTGGYVSAQCILASFYPNDENLARFLESYGVQEDERGDRVYIFGSVDALDEESDTVRAMYFHMVGSSNGLACFADRDYSCFRIWNPCTDECHTVEDSPLTGYDRAEMQICTGFGYVWSEDNYKIVVAALRKHSDDLIFVYSLRANEWKQKSCSLSELGGYKLSAYGIEGRGVLVNEKLHWVEETTEHAPSEDVFIVVFGLDDEEFETVLGPSDLLQLTYVTWKFQLCEIDGFLGIHSTIMPDWVWILVDSEWVDYSVPIEDLLQNSWLLIIFGFIRDGSFDWMYYKFDMEIYQDAMFYVETLESPLSILRKECR